MRAMTDDELRALPLAIVVNARCGHVAGTCGAEFRWMADQTRNALVAAGRRGWRVEVRPATDAELMGLLAGTRCALCRFD